MARHTNARTHARAQRASLARVTHAHTHAHARRSATQVRRPASGRAARSDPSDSICFNDRTRRSAEQQSSQPAGAPLSGATPSASQVRLGVRVAKRGMNLRFRRPALVGAQTESAGASELRRQTLAELSNLARQQRRPRAKMVAARANMLGEIGVCSSRLELEVRRSLGRRAEPSSRLRASRSSLGLISLGAKVFGCCRRCCCNGSPR